ncbi:MAG: dCTP deaminase [Chloroflexota bacterium]
MQSAYVAGLLDADGEIGYQVSSAGGKSGLALTFGESDRSLLERLQVTISTGKLRESSDGRCCLAVTKAADVQCLLSQVLPYLRRQRNAASRALAELKSNKSIVVDPKAFDAESFVDFQGDVCVIPPNSFALGRTVEYFRVPRGVLTVCVGKSSYARCGIIVNVTPFEPEWEGYVTLEISNTTPLPAKIYANEGIAQVLFFEGDEECETSYADKKGKYQRQQSIVLPRL